MVDDTDNVTEANEPAPNGGMLDLDLEEEEEEEEEVAASGFSRLDNQAPEWKGDDQLFIDVDGHIHVRGGRFFHSRVVGRVRGEDGAATLGVLVDRFQALEDRFAALQREMGGSRNLVRNLKSMRSFVHWVEGAEAIGDFAGLLERAHGVIAGLEEEIEASRASKRELAERAEELATSTSWKATGEVMDELMEAWKRAGSAGGKTDDELWERFNTARRTFYERRSGAYAEQKRVRNADRQAKKELIARAAELAPSDDWEETSEAMQGLMDEWKQLGPTGRRQDEELWQQFMAARQPFFDRRKAHFAEQRSRQHQQRGPRGPHRPDRDGPRRGRGERGRPGGDRPALRGRSSGPLQASLAELVGPLRGLFPDKRDRDKSEKNGKGKQESKRR